MRRSGPVDGYGRMRRVAIRGRAVGGDGYERGRVRGGVAHVHVAHGVVIGSAEVVGDRVECGEAAPLTDMAGCDVSPFAGVPSAVTDTSVVVSVEVSRTYTLRTVSSSEALRLSATESNAAKRPR